ncbi:MAG: DUF2281 domain-containing protein [Planctomycetes bacterium]|nr:DUF2281 domain-containing protein [Planctomycetota bacterium]
MTTLEQITELTKDLPPGLQSEVRDFAEFLRQRYATRQPLKSIRGLCKDLAFDLTLADLDLVRQEMWGAFPRERS